MYAPPLMRHESSPLPMSQPANMAAIDSLYANDLARRLSITGSTSEDIISSLRCAATQPAPCWAASGPAHQASRAPNPDMHTGA